MTKLPVIVSALLIAAPLATTAPRSVLAQPAHCSREFIVFFPARSAQLAGGGQGVIDLASKYAA
ncbi:MAG TPA: hypothetical protein VFN88_13080, partial [Caulobacteraceae bacterium]|nr:hypothetical protein [Caulobacteraceae bacterium]